MRVAAGSVAAPAVPGQRAPTPKVRFASDSLLEGAGFEPSVPRKKQPFLAAPLVPLIRLPQQKPALSCQGPMVRIHLPPAAGQPLLSPRVKRKSGENCDCRPHRSVGWARSCPDPARPPTRIRGTVDKLNGQNLMVKSRDGQTLTIELPANVAAITLVKSEPCQKAKGRREMLEVASIQAQGQRPA